jgi:Tfp pilus assembly protein PilO
MSARDRKIVMALVPLLIVVGYWFMILAPKRTESQRVTQELTKAQGARDAAEQQVAQLNAAKASFANDYETVIRLGKAVPTSLDMASLLVQVDRAARGTGIQIEDFKPGQTAASGSSGSGASTPPGGGSNPAAPGSAPAQGFPGKQAQNAGTAVDKANKQEQSNADSANSVGSSAAAGSTTSAPGLVAVPLTFTVTGGYFGLSDFLHRMKRFVRVVNDQIVVRGRLLTIEGFSFERPDDKLSILKADVTATIYLTPPDEGATAGATPAGPGGASGSGAATGSSSSTSSSTPTAPTPTATATP